MLSFGDALYLEWVNEKGEIERYKTVVSSKDERIYVEIPINVKTNKYGFFIQGTLFQASYYDAGKVFHFETEILGRMRENVPLLILSYPGDEQLTIIQRRKHVRVETNLSVAIHSPNQKFNPFTTTLNDLSGGGCSVHLPDGHHPQEGSDVYLWIVLLMQSGRYHYFKILSRFIRTIKSESSTIGSFEFKNIESATQMHIIRYCFQRDLYLKKMVKAK